jgi:mannose-1-phosphate guanylyltransferase
VHQTTALTAPRASNGAALRDRARPGTAVAIPRTRAPLDGATKSNKGIQMPHMSNRWALVLAAGSGTRLVSLTTDATGASVPKQFCSLNGGASLLEQALARAGTVTTPAQTIVVVAAEHRRHWQTALPEIPAHNVIVQPRNRGTANGILLGVTAILERDADALVAIVPSDHFVQREHVLASTLDAAIGAVGGERAASIGFLGLTPESADPELGYIVRGEPLGDGSCAVARFVEKPARAAAAQLRRRRALWNSFIMVARGATLVDLVALRYPGEVAAFRALWRSSSLGVAPPLGIERLYDSLRDIDFSRNVVEGTSAPLHVVPVPACGWSDLGTPQRVAECLARLSGSAKTSRPSTHFDLSAAYARLIAATPSARTA